MKLILSLLIINAKKKILLRVFHSFRLNKFVASGTIDSGTAARAVAEGIRRSNAAGNVDARSNSFRLRSSGETSA